MTDINPDMNPRLPEQESNADADGLLVVSGAIPNELCDNRARCILDQLNELYEGRLAEIEEKADNNCELKYLTYKDWNEMLLKVMKDLIEVLQELEYEASSRIELLEKKLHYENMLPCGNITDTGKLKNDVANMIELIRRALNEGKWNIDGLDFYTIDPKDIFGKKLELSEGSNCSLETPRQSNSLDQETVTGVEEDIVFKSCIADLKDCLKEKEFQLADTLKQNECLETELRRYKNEAAQKDKAVANMRALAFEVADKHDQLIEMRNQVNSLEEELKKAHKKVQFKDNVIRELRREIKTTSKNEQSENRNPSLCVISESGSPESDLVGETFRTATGFNDSECTQPTDFRMNTVDDPDAYKFRSSATADEDRCIQTLKDELDDLLKYHYNRNELIEDQNRVMAAQHNRLNELISSMLRELSKNRSKLDFIRTQLVALSNESAYSEQSLNPDDSGYVTPEYLEPESRIIESLRSKFKEIQCENETLKTEVRQNPEIEDSSDYGNSGKLLQEVARSLSNICGRPIPYEITSIDSCEGEIHPICQAMVNLQTELREKDETLCASQEVLQRKDFEIQKLQRELCHMEAEVDVKNRQIGDLEKTINFHISSMDRLKCANKQLGGEVNDARRKDEDADYKTLLDSKQKLEIECENQVTTINNLRQALENMKKSGCSQTGHSVPNVCADLGHDILSEQLLVMFEESMLLEKKLLHKHDENLCLKEILVDAESGYQNLEKKYINLTQQNILNNEVEEAINQLNVHSKKVRTEIQKLGGEQLYISCFGNIRNKMENECRVRLQNQEMQYREIINDLTDELTSLSDQVQATRKVLDQDELDKFDVSFRELETQNEMLQRTIEGLKRKIEEYEQDLNDTVNQIRCLQSQNATSTQRFKEKDAKYRDLSHQYQQMSRALQTLRTNCECGALKYIHADLTHAERIASLLANEIDDSDSPISAEHIELEQTAFSEKEKDDQVRQMKAKIDVLEKTLEKREQDLRELHTRMIETAQRNGELTSELYLAQDQVFYLQAEDERLRDAVDRMSEEVRELRNSRRDREGGLIHELNRLRHTLDQHVNAMGKQTDTINMLERQMDTYRRQGDSSNKENAMLKAELFKLRESLATQDGIEKSLKGQLVQTESEMTMLKCNLERYACLTQDIDNLKKHCGRLKEANFDIVKKYNVLVEDYNHLEEEYRKLIELKDQLFDELENTRLWQKEQIEQDKIIKCKFRKLEEHIDLLLDDRKNLISKINDLHRDTVLISGELEQYKDACTGTMNGIPEHISKSLDLDGSNVDTVIRKIRRTARKLSQTRTIWQNGFRRSSD